MRRNTSRESGERWPKAQLHSASAASPPPALNHLVTPNAYHATARHATARHSVLLPSALIPSLFFWGPLDHPIRNKQYYFLLPSATREPFLGFQFGIFSLVLVFPQTLSFGQIPHTPCLPYLPGFPRDATNFWTNHQPVQKPLWILLNHISEFKTVVPACNWKSPYTEWVQSLPFWKKKKKKYSQENKAHDSILQSADLSSGSSQEGERGEGLLSISVQGLSYTIM